jgi:hypothetical protein
LSVRACACACVCVRVRVRVRVCVCGSVHACHAARALVDSCGSVGPEFLRPLVCPGFRVHVCFGVGVVRSVTRVGRRCDVDESHDQRAVGCAMLPHDRDRRRRRHLRHRRRRPVWHVPQGRVGQHQWRCGPGRGRCSCDNRCLPGWYWVGTPGYWWGTKMHHRGTLGSASVSRVPWGAQGVHEGYSSCTFWVL